MTSLLSQRLVQQGIGEGRPMGAGLLDDLDLVIFGVVIDNAEEA